MKLSAQTSLASMALPGLTASSENYRCKDGTVGLRDIAKAAGCSTRQARRAISEFVERHEKAGRTDAAGAILNVGEDEVPPPGEGTVADLAVIVARRIGAGKFGVQQRIAERAASRPPAKPKEKRMSAQQHPWTVGKHGRAVRSCEGGGVEAVLTCEKADCSVTETIRFRQLAGATEMDRKFIQKGWAVDPCRCPEHNRRHHPRKDTLTMATHAPSPGAIAAQAKMFGLLQTHFDADGGCYGGGYSDAKIAAETGLSVDLVKGVREQAFGPLREPPEIAQLASDIEALSNLIDDAVAPLKTELAQLRSRLGELRRKFGG